MNRQEYIDFILDHYESPRNHGKLADASVVQYGGNPGCGDEITLYLRVDEDECIEEVRFEGEGCTISQAGASVVTEIIKGKTLQEVENLSVDTILELLGREVVSTRLRCALLGISTAKEAVYAYRRQQRPHEASIGAEGAGTRD